MHTVNAKHKAGQTLLLHLAPGILFTLLNFALMPWVSNMGFPNDLAADITTLLGTVPVLIGILLYIVHKDTGTYHIKLLFPYLEKSNVKDYLIFIPIMAVWAILISNLLTPFEETVRDTVFAFLPAQFILGNYGLTEYAQNNMIITYLIGIVCNGIVAPVTEELYFRGYLLPRIDASPIAAVLINAVLFSFQHFATPWFFFSRVLMMIPLYYWVVKKRNMRFSIIAHGIANCVTSASLLFTVL